MSKILFLVMCVLCYVDVSSSAAIIKGSGVQWSEPKLGKGNVTLVMIPLNDLSDNNSDVIVAVKSDSQFLTDDTQVLNLIVQENVNNETHSEQCPNVEGNDEEQQREINKIKSPNSANYFEPANKFASSAVDVVTKNYFQPRFIEQNAKLYVTNVTPHYTDINSKAPFSIATPKSMFVQEALNMINKLRYNPSCYNEGTVKSNNSDIISFSNKRKDGETINTNIKQSNIRHLESALRNGEFNSDKSNKFDDKKRYRSNLEAIIDVLNCSSTSKAGLPVPTTSITNLSSTAVSQENAQNLENTSSSEGNPNVTLEVGVINNSNNNSNVVSETPNPIGTPETQNTPQGSTQNSVMINTTLTLTTVTPTTQNLSNLSSEIPSAVSLATLTPVESSVSPEETIPNHIQFTISSLNVASSPLAGKDNDNEVFKALCPNITTEPNNITGVFEQISKMAEPQVRLEETTTVMSGIGPSDVAQTFIITSSPPENQTFSQKPSECVRNEFKEKFRHAKKVTQEPPKLCEPWMITNRSTVSNGEENVAGLNDMDVVMPLVGPPEVLDNQNEMQEEKNILIESGNSLKKIRLSGSHANVNKIGERENKQKYDSKQLPIIKNKVISNSSQKSEGKSNLEKKIVLNQHRHNKHIYLNPNKNGILKIDIAGKNIVLERKPKGYRYVAPRTSIDTSNQFEEKTYDISAKEKSMQSDETKNHLEESQQTFFQSFKRTTKKLNLKVKDTNSNPENSVVTKSMLHFHDLSKSKIPMEKNRLLKFFLLDTATENVLETSKHNNKENLFLNSAEYMNKSPKLHSSRGINDNEFKDQKELYMREIPHSYRIKSQSYNNNLSGVSKNNNHFKNTAQPILIANALGGIKSHTYKTTKQMSDKEKADQPQNNGAYLKQTTKNTNTKGFSFNTPRMRAKQGQTKLINKNIVIPFNSAKEIVIEIEKHTSNPLTNKRKSEIENNYYDKKSSFKENLYSNKQPLPNQWEQLEYD